MPVIGRFVAVGTEFETRVREGQLVISIIPTLRTAQPFAPSGIICFEPLGKARFVLKRRIDITFVVKDI